MLLPAGIMHNLVPFPGSINNLSLETIKDMPLILHKGNELGLLRPDGDEYFYRTLSTRVDFFKFSSSSLAMGGLFSSLWSCGGNRCQVWTNVNLDPDTPTRWSQEFTAVDSFDIACDMNPLGILLDKGVIMGIEQRVSLKNGLKCAIYRADLKSDLVFQEIIFRVLEMGYVIDCLLFLRPTDQIAPHLQ